MHLGSLPSVAFPPIFSSLPLLHLHFPSIDGYGLGGAYVRLASAIVEERRPDLSTARQEVWGLSRSGSALMLEHVFDIIVECLPEPRFVLSYVALPFLD